MEAYLTSYTGMVEVIVPAGFAQFVLRRMVALGHSLAGTLTLWGFTPKVCCLMAPSTGAFYCFLLDFLVCCYMWGFKDIFHN
jgi:hypothetical protein